MKKKIKALERIVTTFLDYALRRKYVC